MLIKCSKCKRELEKKLFPPNKRRKCGIASWCRECVSEYNKSEKNKEKARIRLFNFRERNKTEARRNRIKETNDVISGESNFLTCLSCRKKKQLTEFNKAKSKLGFSGRCKECNLKKQKEAREIKRESSPFARFDRWTTKQKRAARMKVNNGIAAGTVKKMNCVICDSQKSQAHHENYDKPLDLIWLCSRHHADIHKFGIGILSSD